MTDKDEAVNKIIELEKENIKKNMLHNYKNLLTVYVNNLENKNKDTYAITSLSFSFENQLASLGFEGEEITTTNSLITKTLQEYSDLLTEELINQLFNLSSET